MAKKSDGKKGTGGPKQGPSKDIMESKGTFPIDCKLTDTEVAKLARELVETRGKIAGKEAEKKAADAAIKGDIELLEESANKIQEVIRDGTQQRNTECITQFDWRNGEVRLLRADNREVIKSRTMTPEERQKELFEKGAKEGKGALLLFDGGKSKDRSDFRDGKGSKVERKVPKPNDVVDVETRHGWKSGGKVLPSSGSVLDVELPDGTIAHAPVEGSTWRWPGEEATVGEPALKATLGEVAGANAAKKDKRLIDGAPCVADELMVKTPIGKKFGTVTKIDGSTMFIDIGDDGMPLQVDLGSKDWSWAKDEKNEASSETNDEGGEPPTAKKRGRKGKKRGDGDDADPPEGLAF